MDPAPSTSKNEETRSAISCLNPRTRPYYSRRCKRGNSNTSIDYRRCKRWNSNSSIDSLPDDLLLDILVRVPAEDIHENARLVCQRWKRIIHGHAFVYAHLHRTSHGLLFAEPDRRARYPTFVAATQDGIEISKLSCKLKPLFMVGCNGLLLLEFHKRKALYILNPATKRSFNIPRLFSLVWTHFYGLAYAATSMEYKVVVTYLSPANPLLAQCGILTVGVDDTWRRVPIEQWSRNFKANFIFLRHPVMTEGFIHWPSCGAEGILSLNVETEIITKTPAPRPQDPQNKGFVYYFLSTGKYLSALISCGVLSWEVWEMKGETGECMELVNVIRLNSHKFHRGSLVPVGWVKYPNVLAFSGFDNGNRSIIIYNLDADEIKSVKLSSPIYRYNVAVHKNSLVWFS